MSILLHAESPHYFDVPTYARTAPMSNPSKKLWQVFVDECRQCLIDYFTPVIAVGRWIRRHLRK